jgi:hypothetical protein
LFETNADTVVPDSPVDEESLNNKIVEDVLNSLNDSIHESRVVSECLTSLAQEKPTFGVVGEYVDSQIHEETETDVVKNAGISDADKVMSVEDNVVDVDALDDLQ